MDVDAVVDLRVHRVPGAAADNSRLRSACARQSGGGAVLLADGLVQQFDIYAAEVAWDGGWRPVLVSAVGTEALLGMRLLAGHELRMAVVPGVP